MSGRIFLLLIFCVFNSVSNADDYCNFSTCGDCISRANCVWCAQETMLSNEPRCMPQSVVALQSKTKKWCDDKFIKNPKPEKNVMVNKPFNDTIDGVRVQLRPQRIKIKARPGVIVNFTMSYEPAEDYPLDVYYLMDISYTMIKQKEALQHQAIEIYNKLTEYTNNVRLGIGSFVEKPGFPYVDKNRRPDPHVAHAFRNHLSLTKNMSEFISTLEATEFGGNFDDPECGLDALMQAMTCKSELGWRKGARRIIVLCTDSTYHSAGDGKMIGAIRPNDMQCHLENNLYNDTEALIYDYPSVSQINRIATEGNFMIIFAATKAVDTEYRTLATHILGAKYAILEKGTDAVKVIKEAYREYAMTAKLDYDLPPFIQLTTDQNCEIKPTKNCESTPEQRTVYINGNITIKYCPDDKLKHELKIKAVGLNDTLIIELDIDCKCDCEMVHANISPKCHNAGVSQCGICKCNPGSYGVDCRCNGTSTDTKDAEKCKLNPDDKQFCSGRGICRCGKCESCKIGFSGDHCEFDDNACPTSNKQLCSGNGRCRLGRCECDSQWTNEDCSCTLDNSVCIAPYSKELCSGNGVCKCGQCICNNLTGKNGTYTGSYCDTCDDCAEKRCKELEGYVLCNVMNKKTQCDDQYNVTDSIVVFINKTEINGPMWYMAKMCRTRLENDSYIIFKYKYEDGNIVLGIQNEAELPPKANIYIAVGSAIGIVLLIGILTLILWKILVDLHDKREYNKFASEATAAGYEVSPNPLYTPPASNFRNPAYECQ